MKLKLKSAPSARALPCCSRGNARQRRCGARLTPLPCNASRRRHPHVQDRSCRIYQGIHFRFADVEARKQGRHVAQWAFGHFLRPLGEDAARMQT